MYPRRWALALYLVALVVAAVVPGREPARPDHHRHFMTDQREVPRALLVRDAALNVAVFAPIGFLGWRLLGPARGALVLVIAAAAMLSVGIETLQHFVPWRYSSWLDVVSNTTGATAGALVAANLRRRS